MILKTFANYPPRKRLGLIAILLGVLSIFAGSPFDKTQSSINVKELSLISVDDINKVYVSDLADWVIKGRYDYRLVDLRKEEEHNKYSIPSSENIMVSGLLKSDLARNEKIVLYSDNEIESSQAWFLLKAEDYKGVYILDGGLKGWKENILFPKCTCGLTPTVEQKHKHNKLVEVSKFFGGGMQDPAVEAGENKMKMPTLKAPAKVTLKKAKGKKKREGC